MYIQYFYIFYDTGRGCDTNCFNLAYSLITYAVLAFGHDQNFFGHFGHGQMAKRPTAKVMIKRPNGQMTMQVLVLCWHLAVANGQFGRFWPIWPLAVAKLAKIDMMKKKNRLKNH